MLGPRLLHFSNEFKALKHSHIECTFNAHLMPQSHIATTYIIQAY